MFVGFQALDLKPNYVRAWANMGISYANQVWLTLIYSISTSLQLRTIGWRNTVFDSEVALAIIKMDDAFETENLEVSVSQYNLMLDDKF